MEDVIVCGGGPAGLSAALWCGRYRRKTTVLDGGPPRNAAARASHGLLGSDGRSPEEILATARRDTDAYPTVSLIEGVAERAERTGDGFRIFAGRRSLEAKRVILATGVEDVRPEIPGFDDLYGHHIFHCSCCDGYESRDQDVVAIGWGEHVAGYALDLLEWGARVTLVTNGEEFEGDRGCIVALERHRIEIVEERITNFVVHGDEMKGVETEDGRIITASRAFFSIKHHPRNDLARSLGCRLDDLGYIQVGDHGETSVENVYAVGDVTPGEQLVARAISSGAIAGIACAMSLRGESTSPAAPPPGPDPGAELDAAAGAA